MTSLHTTTKKGTHIDIEGAGPKMSLHSVPSNKQIDSMLTGAQRELEEQKPRLDEHGQHIAASTQDVLGATSQLLKEKNKEERFQKLILFTKGSSQGEGLAQAAQKLMAQSTGMGTKISDDATDVFSYIRQTLLNVTTNMEFRQLSVEFLDFLQSMLGEVQRKGETKQKGQSLKDKLKTHTYDTAEERHDAINEKLETLLSHVAQKEEFRNVVRNFMKYSELIFERLYRVKEDTKQVKEDQDLRAVVNEAWELLNDFVGRDTNLVPNFKTSLNDTIAKIRSDHELANWTQEFKQVINDLIDDPENSSKHAERTHQMIERGTQLSDKFRGDLENLYADAQRIFHRISHDPVVKNFQEQLEKLGKDIALNNQGQPDLFVFERSVSTIKNLLIDRFRKILSDVPIQRAHIRNDSLDLLLTNITIEGNGLLPNHLHVQMISSSHFDFEKSLDAEQIFKIRIRVDQIRPLFKEVNFAYEKKTFPKFKDHGIASLLFDGNGLSTDVVIEFLLRHNELSQARLTKSLVTLDKVNLTFEKSKHSILDTILTPIFQTAIKKRIENGIRESVEKRLRQIVDQLNDWFETKPFEKMMVRGNETLQKQAEKLKTAPST